MHSVGYFSAGYSGFEICLRGHFGYLTHNLTQNRKNPCGISGRKRAGKDMLLDAIASKSTRNVCIPSLRAATDQKAGGSNPSRRAKTPEKSGDFSGVLLAFCTFCLL